jgi:CBS domain-containing protein
MIAHRLSDQIGIPARAIYGRRRGDEHPQAQAVLANIAADLPALPVETIEAANPAAMVGSLPAGTLLVVGAPGGSWFQRQFFGPGARIQAKSPNGTIVVKHVPPRVYQIMQPPTAFGPHMRVADAAQLAAGQHVIVALDGQLLGVAYTHDLQQARPDRELGDLMDDPVFLNADEDIAHATELIAHHGSPVPVVDAQTRLIGVVTATDLEYPLLG